ncbi:MAG: double-strand break repair protein AddB [Tagaea sp.]|nr:double-strand break repair protein AddB [Tagaea sp.]
MGVSTIPAGEPFLAALARGVRARLGDAPQALARATILLPNRRAVRALGEAFLAEAGGKPLLLPRLAAIGDVDEDELILTGAEAGLDLELPPAIDPAARALLLASLVARRTDIALSPATALKLARALAELLDSLQIEEISWDGFDALVPADYAEHWARTLDFLGILRQAWPAILAERGQMDPQARRVKLIRALAARWAATPPKGPIWAAGSTGSVPASAHLLKTIADLPEGEVVLPGLDLESDAATWEAIGAEPTHPQYGLHHLLLRMERARAEVGIWPGTAPGPRASLAAEALRPARTTHLWRGLAAQPDAAFAGLVRIEAPDPEAEAGAVALVLREALETPGRTATLVTADRGLARRVSAKLRRWGIEADDSAGASLDRSPPAVLLRLLARAWAEDLAPVPLLALLKHPLVRLGSERASHLDRARELDLKVLRGPRPAPGLDGVRAAMPGYAQARLTPLLDALDAALAPLTAAPAAPLDLLRALAAAAEALTRDENGAIRLWENEAGNALAALVARLLDSDAPLAAIPRGTFPDLLDEMLAGAVVRPPYGGHPRLTIRGTIEARLVSADLVVLGGLNEGTWPGEAREDPWLSRPMRARLGLPPLERQIGLAAHDFAQAFAGASVVLTRARKGESGPAIASRWLVRLDALLGGDSRWRAALDPDRPAWAATLAGLGQTPAPIAKPAPRPPAEARPAQLSVTRIETLIRDPYAIYASKILRLDPLEDIDADVDALARGKLYHAAMDEFAKAMPADLPADAAARLRGIGRRAFDALAPRPGVRVYWWPRFEAMIEWFVDAERARRDAGLRVAAAEVKGRLDIDGFALTATADRIDRDASGKLIVLDYKTGTPPSAPQVATGFSPQLPLEALIAEAGGFEGVAAGEVAELVYVGLGSRAGFIAVAPGEKTVPDLRAFLAETRADFAKLIAAYADPATPYLSRPRLQFTKDAGDYDHLARVAEWSAGGGEE